MLAVLRQRNFSLLWFGQLVSIAGDWVLFIALPFYVYDLTGSALATGGMFIASTLPRVLLGSVAGVFVDRWDRKRTMIAADLLRAVLVLALLGVRSVDELWLVYLVGLLQAALSQFFVPAKNAIVPNLVSADDLVPANSLNSLGESVARLLAPPLGGALFAWLGLPSSVIFDSASFLFSALLLALISMPSVARPAVQAANNLAHIWVSFWREWIDGLRVMSRDRTISILFLVMAIAMIGEGLLDVLLIPFVERVMHGDSLTLGWFMSAQAIGSLLGGSVIGSLGKRISGQRLVMIGCLGWGVFDFVIFNTASFALALVVFVIVGIPLVGLMVSTNALLQANAGDAYRGRIFGALGTTIALMTMTGMAISSLCGDRLGIVPTLNIACVLFIVAAIVAQAWLPGKETQIARAPDTIDS